MSLEDDLAKARARNADRLRPRSKQPKQRTPEEMGRRANHPLALWYAEEDGLIPRRNMVAGQPVRRMPVPDKVVELNSRQYRKINNPKKGLSRFGLTYEQWERMVDEQESRCAICEAHVEYAPSLAVDHCHNSGRVRGLLCRKCNTAIGQLNDDPGLLRKAAEYIERHREQTLPP